MSNFAGGSPSFHDAMASDVAHLGMQVTPENIVGVCNVLRAEATYLTEVMQGLGFPLQIGMPGLDEVSKWAASEEGFNGKLRAMAQQCKAYPDELDKAADQLAAQAKLYGHTEQSIRDSFSAYYPGYKAKAIGKSPR